MFKRLFSLSKPVQNILSIVFYGIFFVYMVMLILGEPDLAVKILYLVMLVGLGGVAAWYEWMKYLLYASIKQTILLCDEKKALARLNRLEQLDLRHTFEGSVCILRLMLHRDHGRFSELASLASEKALTVMAKDPELKLVARHSRFIAYGELGDIEQCTEFYHSLYEVRTIRVDNKLRQISPYYSWDEIDAAYHYYNGKYTAGLRSIKKVSEQNMNPRERMHYHHLFARLLYQNGSVKKACGELELAIASTARNTEMKALLENLRDDWTGQAD